jgi:hypothetical protein
MVLPPNKYMGLHFCHYQVWEIKTYEMTQCPFQISWKLVNLFKSWNEGDKHTNSAQWPHFLSLNLFMAFMLSPIHLHKTRSRWVPFNFSPTCFLLRLPRWCISTLKQSQKGMIMHLLLSDHSEYGNISEKYLPIHFFLQVSSAHILLYLTSFISTPKEDTIQYFPPKWLTGPSF